MYSENSVSLIGNTGTNINVETIPTGSRKASFRMATNITYKDDAGERQQRTEWHNVVAWSPRLIELLEKHVAKGDFLRVQGELRTSSWTKEIGGEKVTFSRTDVVANRIGFLSPRDDQPAGGEAPQDEEIPY